jgi:hydroxymethylpyrimidine/phosphomethylpyrimidine kinase
VVKTGMLGTPAVVALVADRLGRLPLVVDPVLVATSGAVLGDEAVVAAYREHLLPLATVVTPNLAEARALAGRDVPSPDLAARLADLGCAVVLTGGPEWRPGQTAGTCTDWVCLPGGRPEPLGHAAVATTADHGTGCTFASALAGLLAPVLAPLLAETRGHNPHPDAVCPPADLTADALVSACRGAAGYVTTQLHTSSTWALGRGRGPIAHTQPPEPPI